MNRHAMCASLNITPVCKQTRTNGLPVLFHREFVAFQQRAAPCAEGEVQDRHWRLPIAVYAYSKKHVLKSFIHA